MNSTDQRANVFPIVRSVSGRVGLERCDVDGMRRYFSQAADRCIAAHTA